MNDILFIKFLTFNSVMIAPIGSPFGGYLAFNKASMDAKKVFQDSYAKSLRDPKKHKEHLPNQLTVSLEVSQKCI